MTDEKTFLTPAAFHKLEEELEHLKTEGRREIEERIAEARSHGDLRENADYDAAKNEQGHNEARVRHLQLLLKDAVIVDSGAADRVATGTVVELRYDDEEHTTRYLVGSIEERHDAYDVLSVSAPLGQAVLGASPGEQRTYAGPRGNEMTVEIVSVHPLD